MIKETGKKHFFLDRYFEGALVFLNLANNPKGIFYIANFEILISCLN